MEEMLCARALKSAYGRQKHHTQTCLHVCCERALKSAGKQKHTRGGGGGSVRETVCTGDFGSNCSDIQRRLGCGGWLALCRPSTGCVVRRAASPHAARCAHAVLADYNLNIYITSHYVLAGPSGPGGGAGRRLCSVGRGPWDMEPFGLSAQPLVS
jgi:hypothetical protein